MPLTSPMYAIPGEMLITTRDPEETTHNSLWRVPRLYFDASGELVRLKYGDLMLVLASWRDDKLRWECSVLLQRSDQVIHLHEVENIGWLWRA